MEKIKKYIFLKEEAVLMDSEIYILKAFLAIATAYLLAKHNTLIKLDTISVFFGLMLTLEPVTLTGIKFGFNQLYASFIGGAVSAIIIYIFGINFISAALAVSLTLYVCLKINWREASVVAIFTSIYMTQYVQKDLLGNPSILLTFKLRMAALGTGVAIAILYNFIFSLISYKSMFKKRLIYLLKAININLEETRNAMNSEDINELKKAISKLPQTFNNIDWVNSHLEDKKKEFFSKELKKKKRDSLNVAMALQNLRAITHLNYDILYTLISGTDELNSNRLKNFSKSLFDSSENIKILCNSIGKNEKNINWKAFSELDGKRIANDLNAINNLIIVTANYLSDI